jgi:hypothetical protein
MASFYDSASIITIPSGYKAGTLYSQIPTDGTGDMSFTRTGDTATRVNSAGIIETCITNLALQSNGFLTASWFRTGITVTSGITDPNGGTTAFSMAGTSSTSAIKYTSQAPFTIANDVKTFSVYAKANTHSFLQLRLTTAGIYVNFDLTNGTFSNGASGIGTITSIGGGWYRCQMTPSGATTNTIAAIQLVDSLSAGINEASTTTNSIYIWRAQAQLGDLATNYIDTTTAAVTTGPVTNLPRLDYFGSTCPQLLMEPTRTNLMTYSQMFNDSGYVKSGVSVSGNVAVSPDGYSNADVMVEDNTSSGHRIIKTISFVSGTTYTMSCFVKQGSGTRRFQILFPLAAFTSNLMANFNLQTGVITTSGSVTAKIENYGNGWYRCIATATATITASSSFIAYLRNSDVADTNNYTGDGTSSLYLWGAQVEAGAYATSYIPTTAATVTRNADVCSKTGISSLIGQTEGTIFVNFKNDLNSNSGIDRIISISDGTSNNRIYIARTSGNASYFVSVSGGSVVGEISGSALPSGDVKLALAYKQNDCIIYINGVSAGTDTSVTIPACSQLFLGQENGATTAGLFKPYNQVLVFKTRLTNDELATLTTL